MGTRHVVWWTALFTLLVVASSFPRNEYEYAVNRDWLKFEERLFRLKDTALTPDEATVDQYLSYLKWQEFQATRPAIPPLRPIEETLPHILQSELFQVLKPLPKGGDMHGHENHMLSKRVLLDIVWESEDFQHLYMLPENASTPYRLDFFLNPPEGEGWFNVRDSGLSKEDIYRTQVFMEIMDDNAKRYPTDSRERWRQMNPLWGRGSYQLISNAKIRPEYVWKMLETAMEDGVQYMETRRSLGGYMYVLDPSPEYEPNNGKHVIDVYDGELDVNVTFDVVSNFTQQHPSFIGYKNIISSSRWRPADQVQQELERALRFHQKFPDKIVGYDLVAEEDNGRAHLFYLKNFLTLYDDQTQRSKIDLYLHTAETNFPNDLRTSDPDDDPVASLENTYESILLGANRVGHGIGFFKHPYLLEIIKERQVAIETCPVSNQLLGFMADLRNHPALNYIRSGIPVIMGSDDPGTFGYDHFTVDWYMAYLGWGLDLADLRQLARDSLNHSAMDVQEKVEAFIKWELSWTQYITDTRARACSTTFPGPPVFSRILPDEGSRDDPTTVYIFGHGFEHGICKNVLCRFGDLLSPATRLVSNQLIICDSPVPIASKETQESNDYSYHPKLGFLTEGSPKTNKQDTTVPVLVSFDGGQNFVDVGSNFTYRHNTFLPKQNLMNSGGMALGSLVGFTVLLTPLVSHLILIF